MVVMKAGKHTLAKSATPGDGAFVSWGDMEVVHLKLVTANGDLIARGMPAGWLPMRHVDDALRNLALPAAIDIEQVLDVGCGNSPVRDVHEQPEDTPSGHERGTVQPLGEASLGALAENESCNACDQNNNADDKPEQGIRPDAVRSGCDLKYSGEIVHLSVANNSQFVQEGKHRPPISA